MAVFPKNDFIIGFAKQSAKGSANTTPEITLWSSGSSTLGVKQDKQDIDETHGFPIAQDSWIASIEGSGDTIHYFMPISAGFFLNAILGRDTKTGSGDPYTHTEDWGASAPGTLPYITALISRYGALYGEMINLRLNHVKVEGSSNGLVMITCSWVGGTPTYRSSTALSASDAEVTNRIRFADARSAIKFAGSALPFPESIAVDIDRGLTVAPSDTTTPDDTLPSAFAASAQLAYKPASLAILKHTQFGADAPSDTDPATTTPYEPAGSPAGVNVKFTAATGPERSVNLQIPRGQVDPFDDAVDTAPGPLVETINFKAYGPSSGTSPVIATVLNSRSTAY